MVQENELKKKNNFNQTLHKHIGTHAGRWDKSPL